MGAKDHRRLTQGSLLHCKAQCNECKVSGTIRHSIDEDNGLEILERYTECQKYKYDFSVGLLCSFPGISQKPYVMRGCSSHANFHLHVWEPLKPFSAHGNIKMIQRVE